MTSTISQKSATAIGLGAIIGAGIFVLSGTALSLAGSYSLFSFVLVGVVALIVSFELGELASTMPDAQGASYSYVHNTFGSELGFITGILLYFSYVSSIPVIALGFGSYLSSLLGFGGNNYEVDVGAALGLITVLAIVNILGVSKAAKTELGLVAFKIFILLIFVSFAFVFSLHLNFSDLSTNFNALPGQRSFSAIFAASVAVFFAYAGFQSISTITSEVKGGSKGAAKAIIYAVMISLILYVLVVVALMLLAPASSYGISGDPITHALKDSAAPISLSVLIQIGALVATTSATLAMILTSSRILHQLSMDGMIPRKIAANYNPKRDVPTNGVIISTIVSLPFLLLGNIYVIAAVSNFGLIFSYMMASLAIFKVRRRNRMENPSEKKPFSSEFKTPFFPYLPFVAIIALLLFILGMPEEALIIGVIALISLLVVYQFLRREEGEVTKRKLFER